MFNYRAKTRQVNTFVTLRTVPLFEHNTFDYAVTSQPTLRCQHFKHFTWKNRYPNKVTQANIYSEGVTMKEEIVQNENEMETAMKSYIVVDVPKQTDISPKVEDRTVTIIIIAYRKNLIVKPFCSEAFYVRATN